MGGRVAHLGHEESPLVRRNDLSADFLLPEDRRTQKTRSATANRVDAQNANASGRCTKWKAS